MMKPYLASGLDAESGLKWTEKVVESFMVTNVVKEGERNGLSKTLM